MPTANKAVVSRLLEEVWNKGHFDALDDLVAAGYRSHIEETHAVRTSRHTGPSIPRTEIGAYRSGMPNLHLDVATLVDGDDGVVAIWRASGDNTGEAMVEGGDEVIPPSGRAIEAMGFGAFVVTDGKIAEAAIRWAPLGPLTQMRLFAAGKLELQLSGETINLTL